MLQQPSITYKNIVSLQRVATANVAEMTRLILLNEQLHDPDIAEAISIRTARSRPLYFPASPFFIVPDLSLFANDRILIGEIEIERA